MEFDVTALFQQRQCDRFLNTVAIFLTSIEKTIVLFKRTGSVSVWLFMV